MYEETGCFDPNSMVEGADDGLCQVLQIPPQPQPLMAGSTTNSHNSYEENLKLSADQELSYHHSNNPHHHHQEDDASASAAAAMETQLQNHQMGFDTHLMQDSSNQVMAFNSSTSLQDATFAQTPDLLNLFHLPRGSTSSLLPNSSISFTNPSHTAPLGFVGDLPMADTASASSILYDPLFHLNLPPQPPLFRDLFQSLPPHGYSLPGSMVNSLFGAGVGGDDHVEGSGDGGGIYQDGDGEQQFDNGVLDFTWDMPCMGKGRDAGKKTKPFATERQRRQHLNDKYKALQNLVPNPTKADRTSVVGDAIDYIKELLRTVNELKLLVEKKRCARERSKRQKTEEDSIGNGHDSSCITKPLGDPDQSFNNGSLRSSWIERKSKDTEVDVRIIDDEVTIKLVQRKKINCLLFVSKVLDELQLDLHHVAGGHIGDYYSFLFNTKIFEGSSVYASAIANKLIEVVDRHYASTPSTN
ncbi:transcription factor bHLH91 [Ricinus communis]|uniref:Transcription factor ICE1, putative n=1 Tax=Ricinus communis TaxID=3988 RepID=B9T7Y5_RICCO|nr:transcription factor bHLH91 [Ricinus communis]EEF28027.1 Transcription factor ICE1, putative [Ricinus communis]|eukprot:XP_002534354.1 transcription factor bHLH91 [Ricinus communis]